MTQYGTLRLWAAFHVLRRAQRARRGCRHDHLGHRGGRRLGDAWRSSSEPPSRSLLATMPIALAQALRAIADGRHRRCPVGDMAEPRVKSLAKPDEVMSFPLVTVRVVDLGDITVGHFVNEPGWSWKECIQPSVW